MMNLFTSLHLQAQTRPKVYHWIVLWVLRSLAVLSSLFRFVCSEDWTQGFGHARQVVYHWATPLVLPFFSFLFCLLYYCYWWIFSLQGSAAVSRFLSPRTRNLTRDICMVVETGSLLRKSTSQQGSKPERCGEDVRPWHWCLADWVVCMNTPVLHMTC